MQINIKKLSPLAKMPTYEEIDAALSLLRKQEDMLCRMPKDYVKAQTDTECIVIRMEELGIKVAA